VSFEAAALTEPAAVCYQSLMRAGLQSGDSVLVVGDGPFGFLHTQIAVALGAAKVICAGHYDQRLERIRNRTGATVCNTKREDLGDLVKKEIPPPGVDVAIEATGSGAAPTIGLRLLRPRGILIVFSYIWKPEVLDMGLIHMRELNVLGSCRSHRAFGTCLDLIAQGRIDTESLIDRSLPLEDFQRGLRILREEKANIFKVVFELRP
jgi:threonine dehydrogenase-like Zn-dependent dehydrogenase